MEGNNRILSFDFFRAYGCLAVIMLHVLSGWRDDPTNGAAYFAQDTVRMLFDNAIVPLLVRLAVPLFFMMSGALFLDPERDVSWQKIRRHVVKLLIVLGLFGYPMAVIELIVKTRTVSPEHLWIGLLNLLQGQSWSHLWYLYATIGLYLITPFLRAWLAKADKNECRLVIVGAVVLLSVIPTINGLTGLSLTSFGISSPGGALLFYLMGYYLSSARNDLADKTGVVAAIAGGVVTAAFGLLGFKTGHDFDKPFYLWIVVYSSAVFLILLKSRWIESLAHRSCVKYIASLSFAIYVIHPIFLNALYKGAHIYPDRFPPIAGELAIWAVVSAASAVGAAIIKRLPGIKNYI